jgi:hypothetical protein
MGPIQRGYGGQNPALDYRRKGASKTATKQRAMSVFFESDLTLGLNTAAGMLGECLVSPSRRYLSSASSSFLFKLTMSQMFLLFKHPAKSDYR